ncbi:MAG: phosphomannomutase/phosphoglucomutase [Planctomycetes bacterium]|jgi:phosphomannomutase|nr:phosphomannomutase/phosphoglucomutase [Planctomycetota bacterium]MCL4730796.1 phosphomannomutase/phosphoglucomutase [Planctomycetota bacterium]
MGLFKAYDVRGVVPDQLNPDVAFRIGWAFARLLGEDTQQPRVCVGMDARPSSPAIAQAFCDGLQAGDARPGFIGPCSTPMLYFAVAGRQESAAGGAMITASHNPARYNGIKFCREDAIPIASNTGLADIEALSASAPEPPRPFAAELRVTLSGNDSDVPAPLGFDAPLWAAYVSHLRKFIKRTPEGLSVAVDSANGMGGAYLGLLRSLGLNLHVIHGEFDGTFPNHEANPSKLDNLKPLIAVVRDKGCALGIALDGDADRAVFVDHTGTPVGQDMVTALLGLEALRRQKGGSVLYDLRSSRAVAEAIEAAGGRPVRERVGHSFMKQTMRKVGCVVGGELAGHYYFKDNFYADSAIIAVIEVLNAMGRSGEPLAELIRPLRKYVQTGEVNFKVDDAGALFERVKEQFKDARIDTLDGITVQYPDWWFNLRASNTEPYVRLNLEAATREQLKEKFEQLAAVLGHAEE